MTIIEESKTIRPKVKPTFVEIGGEKRISTGRWNFDLMAVWLIENAKTEPQLVSTVARVAFGAATIKNKKLARSKLCNLGRTLMDLGEVMLVEYEQPHNRARAVKLYDAGNEVDVQTLNARLLILQDRGDLLASECERARQIAEALNRAAAVS